MLAAGEATRVVGVEPRKDVEAALEHPRGELAKLKASGWGSIEPLLVDDVITYVKRYRETLPQ